MRSAILFCLIVSIATAGKPAKDIDPKQMEIDRLAQQIAQTRDSLQNEIADRWRAKQQAVARREADKEEIERLREIQEKAYGELARIKEERLAVERGIDEARKNASAAEDSWKYVGSSLDDVLAKTAEEILNGFPLDREAKRADVENIRREYKSLNNPVKTIADYISLEERYLGKGLRLSLEKQSVLPDTGSAQDLTVARFGSVFAYGINDSGHIYIISQTGRLGKERFTVQRIGTETIVQAIKQLFPQWIQNKAIAGEIPVDVMHTEASRILLAGKKVGASQKFKTWFRNGGPVMIPLTLVALWGLFLFVLKLIEFGRTYRASGRFYASIIAMMDRGEIESARKTAQSTPGLVAKIAAICLDAGLTDRKMADNAVRKILIEESPRLARHINTLAVLATASPLLGLLGTVTGMINLFAVLTQYGNSDPKLVAGGISEALVTTQAGMIIAIPIVLIHNYLRNTREKIIAEMEKQAIAILNKRWPA